jgi:hypothetical protein
MVITAKTSLIIVTLACTAMFSGAIFGWATLQLIFEKDGVFSDGCEVDTDDVCEEQQNKFSLIYNVTSTLMAFASFFCGLFVDKKGPIWATTMVSDALL